MNNWTDWIDIDLAKSKRGPLNDFGVYEIRAIDSKGVPIAISRLVGVDDLGVLYIGRSGYRHQKTERTIANRIREFLRQTHSGGVTYERARQTLSQSQKFSDHRLQVRAMFVPDEKIDSTERTLLHNYFSKHGEVPPCNSVLPKSEND